jgi:Uma2 family endonuclease
MQKTKLSFEEFLEFVHRPENVDHEWEFINGEILPKMPGRTSNSWLRDLIVAAVYPYCRTHRIPCYTSGETGAYRIGENTVAPDFAYKTTKFSGDYPDLVSPLWVVEVISPTDEVGKIRDKRNIYREAGILFWEIWPEDFEVHVYEQGGSRQIFSMTEAIDLNDVIPGFSIAVADLFE